MKFFYVSLVFILMLFSLLSCNKGNSSVYETDPDRFIKNIESQYVEIEADSIVYLGSDSIYQPNWLISSDDCDQFIIGDSSNKTIVLMNNNGKELSRAGGEGRGPGEFQSILDLHIGNDNRLYILDGLEFRISIYSIGGGNLKYIKSIPFKNPPNHYLRTVYVTEFGNFGVYQESEGFFSAENHFLLYQLNKNFNASELLLKMPGNDRQKVETTNFTYYAPYKYLSQTIWYLDNEWFYYITTLESIVHKYNISTGEQQEITFLQLKNRANSPGLIESVKNNYPVEDKEYWSSLEQIKNLPLFDGLMADGNIIYLTLLPSPGIDGTTLVVDMQSEETKYFRTPQEYFPRTICGDSNYGINFRVNEDYQIMGFELNSK